VPTVGPPEQIGIQANNKQSSCFSTAVTRGQSMATKSIIFIDSRVLNYRSLIGSLTEPAEVFVLDGASDGPTRIAVLNLNIGSN
jgi:hypothetical protein